MSIERGQFAVIRTNGWIAACIRWATKSDWNHAVVITSDHGGIVEANPTGVAYGNLSQYSKRLISDMPLTQDQADKIVSTAEGMLGAPYNFLDIFALALWTRGIRFPILDRRLESSKSRICSQVVAIAVTSAGLMLVPDKRPWQVTPGDEADFILHVQIPERW